MFYEKGSFTTIPNLSLLLGKPPQLQVLFMWLCYHANQDGVCFPSQSLLSKECGMTTRTIRNYLKELVVMDVISYEQRKTEGQKELNTNIYKIKIGGEINSVPRERDSVGVGKEIPYPRERDSERTKTIELKSIELKQNQTHFEEFWKKYPKKIAKKTAEKLWIKEKPDIEKVLHSLSWQLQSEQWTKDGGKFIPYPATWINQRRWEDETKTVATQKNLNEFSITF